MNLISETWRPALCLALSARARTRTNTHTHTHTPPPKFRFSARGGWGGGGSEDCADNGERKSECQGLRVYLAGAPEGDSQAPARGRGRPHFQLCSGAVWRFSDSPFLFFSLASSRFFPRNFLCLIFSALATPSLRRTPPPPADLKELVTFSCSEWELSTSSISPRHIKKSRQVQVNHEMVTF